MSIAELGATARHILGMAKRTQGVSAAEVEDTCLLSRAEAARRLAGLAEMGHLRPIGRQRYVDAARQVAAPAPAPVPPQRAPAPVAQLSPIGAPVRGESKRASGGPAAWRPARKPLLADQPGIAPPVTVRPARPAPGAVVVPPHVRVTVCPSPAYDARYQVDPASRPTGAGFSAAGIGRDVTTGKAWTEAQVPTTPPKP